MPKKERVKKINLRINPDIIRLIGNTPMVRLNNLIDNQKAEIIAKLECFNPGGSIKDRICFSMIKEAEKKGLLKLGSTIVEPTSGNTGIGLAMVGAVKGYKVILTMPETMSLERRYILNSYGAQIVLTPGNEGMEGAIIKAKELVESIPDCFMPQQFENPTNPEIHRQTTAQEILQDVGGKIDAFIAGVGTGGTITGVGEVLKKRFKGVKIFAVEPKASPVLSGGKPGSHKIQGIGAGFIPKVLNQEIIDEVITVDDDDAFRTARLLCQREGIFVGISSGAAAYAALGVASRLGKGKRVVVIFPDTGERYFSLEYLFSKKEI